MPISQARRVRLKENGQCSQCTQQVVPGKSRCQKHLDLANASARIRNAERKKYGLCIRCPNKVKDRHVHCDACLELSNRREVDLNGRRQKKVRTKQQLRMAAGLCKWCDKPNVLSRYLCESHLKSEREKVRNYRADRKAKGLCWRCNNPVRPGGSLCQAHREQVTEKERTGSVGRARLSSSGQVPQQVDPPPVVDRNEAGSGNQRGPKPVVAVDDHRLGVDVDSRADVVEADGIERDSGEELIVEVAGSTDVPGLIRNMERLPETLPCCSVA